MENLKETLSKFSEDRKDDQDAIEDLQQFLIQESGKHEETDPGEGDAFSKIAFHAVRKKEYRVATPKKVTNAARTWENRKHSKYIRPASLRGMVNVVMDAEEAGVRVKAIGSRHSFSEIVHTDGWYIDPTDAHPYSIKSHNKTVDKIDQDAITLLQDTIDQDFYIDVPAGMTIEELNFVLCPSKKSCVTRFGRKRLFNMGGGDVQTFSGAFSTGTHGSGGKHAAYHDMIRSIVVVGSGGKVYRVEPNNGITDKRKHEEYYRKRPEAVQVELIQDNDKFYSLLVSMGCFGLIHSTIVEVTNMSVLKETHTYKEQGWTTELKQEFNEQLLTNMAEKNDVDEIFYYVGINPYTVGNNKRHSVGIKMIKPSPDEVPSGRSKRRKIWPRVLSRFNLPTWIVRTISNSGKFPKRRLIEGGLKASDDNFDTKGHGFIDLAYRVWNTGIGKLINIGTAIEFAFPVEQAPGVLDQLFTFLDHVGEQGNGYYLNSPVSIRFVPASKAYLAANYRFHKGKQVNLWCYIEIARINSMNKKDDFREEELYLDLQQKMLQLGGRPHWGLNCKLPFTSEIVNDLYPNFDRWLEARRFFNPDGRFDNAFSDSIVVQKSEPVPS